MASDKFLFISHADKDSEIVSYFVDLLYAIGLKEKNMFCSSRTELDVPIRENIYDYLRNLLDSDTVIPIFMLSDNYYESAACLNEMGAVWMKQQSYFTFLLPNFEFKQIKGAINPNNKGIKLDCDISTLKGELTNFKDEICKIFDTEISANRWEKERDDFINKLNSNSPELNVSLFDNSGYCIGETIHDGCKVIFDESTNKVTTTYDFTKTQADICSLVFFTGEQDLHRHFKQNKKLHFSLKSITNTFKLTVEMRLKNRNVTYDIQTNTEWENYAIPLQKFGGAESEWNMVTEIKFLVFRNDIKKETIEIKKIKIS